jgi:hypothetical protein
MSDRADALAARAATPPKVTKLRPTLFVALGGTGKEIVLRLRRRILQNDWGTPGNSRRLRDIADFPIASFIYFDTDTTEAVETDRAQRSDPLSRAVAFKDAERLQHGVDVMRYMRELDSYPHIRAWLPDGDLASINTEKGAGQVRSISRLLFFDQFSRFQHMVREQGNAVLNNIGRQQQLADLGLDIEHELRVVVIASSAGGTGSGSFIDAGLAIRSMRDPKPAQVDLVLMLPGGFRGAGLQRVNANSFAALMELEHVMRPGSSPPYVDRWTSDGARPSNLLPFSEAYLIDTTNVSRDQTGDINHLYDMVADVLFEDFGSSEFSSRKRSISVNTGQYKLVNYLPPLPERFGQQSLSYSCAYSSFGQATIVTKGLAALDAASVVASRRMIQSFFNVAQAGSGRLPTPDERQEFVESNFHLGATTFEDTLQGVDDDTINEPALIGELLKQDTGDTVETRLADQIHRRHQEEILASGDLRNWPTQALRIFEESRDDVVGRMDHVGEYGPSGAAIRANRLRMVRFLRSDDEGAVRALLFRFLDNRARGGLDYTIRLVSEAKLRLEEEGRRIADIGRRYEARAAKVRARFDLSLENLRDAGRNRLLLGPDRKAAEKFLDHLREESAYYVKLRLRAVAAAEAVEFVADVSRDLGTLRGRDADGREMWDGAIAELVEGRHQVERVLGVLDDEAALLQDAVGRQNAGTYIVLPDADAEADGLLEFAQPEIDAWAAAVFTGEGGSRALFPRLENPAQLAELLAKLRGYARAQLAPRAERLRSVREILAALEPEQRREILRGAMRRAMPWVNARFDRLGDGLPMGDRYKLYVAVEDGHSFGAGLRDEVRQAIPAALGFASCEIVSSGLRDRLVIYCELSGIPLDTLVPLGDTWRRDYRLERRGPLPLHNHRSAVRFANPVVPTTLEIEDMRRLMGMFLRAVCFGILQRNPGPEAPYKLDLGHNDWEDVGSERDIRADGLLDSHRAQVSAALDRFERALSPVQVLAASVLLRWTGRRAYAARRVQIDLNRSERRPGLLQRVALEASDLTLARFRQMDGAASLGRVEDLQHALEGTIATWTSEVADSVDDIDPFDSNKNPDDPPGLRATDKRTIVPARFATASLTELAAGGRGAPSPAPAPAVAAGAAASAGVAAAWVLSVRKTLLGPYDLAQLRAMAGRGELAEGTNVRAADATAWTKVRDVPLLLALLHPEDLPDDEEAADALPDDE